MADTLSVADYVVFGLTLGISAVIGIFYAIKDRNATDSDEYMMGGRQMSMIPVSLSLSVSFMSAVTVLGTPAEVYRFGTMYWWFLLAMLFVAIITSEIFIPVFYRLGIASTYEYLERRFNRVVRALGTITFVLENVLYGGIVMYAPALALSQVTGLDLWTAVITTGVVCTFYTTLGGLKAVIWTDVFQAIIMLAGFLAVTIKGSIEVGGLDKAWQICEENGRIDFVHFEPDPRIRHTFWTIVVGGTFLWLGVYGVSQSMVQRYLACKSEREAKGALFLNWLGLVIIISLCCINGAIMYAYYHGCDPLNAGEVEAPDQLLPLFSLAIFKDNPGTTGLVVSCVFSGSLSTVSSGINAMSCVTVEDFIKPVTHWKERYYTWASKIAVIIYGGLCLAMAYLASQLGGVLEAALSVLGLVGGPLIGLVTLGMFFNFANSLGAGLGLILGLAMSCWVYIGSELLSDEIAAAGQNFSRILPRYYNEAFCNLTSQNATELTTAETTATISTQLATTVAPMTGGVLDLYSISYVYYSCIGFAATLFTGLIISLLSCGWRNRKDVDSRLLYFFFDHWIFCWIPERYKAWTRLGSQPVDPEMYKESKDDGELGTSASQSTVFQEKNKEREINKNGITNISFVPIDSTFSEPAPKYPSISGSESSASIPAPPYVENSGLEMQATEM